MTRLSGPGIQQHLAESFFSFIIRIGNRETFKLKNNMGTEGSHDI